MCQRIRSDNTPPVREKTRVDTRGEILQGITEDSSSAPRLAKSSVVSFPGRNECPGTLQPDRKGGERRQFLPDLVESLK